ncbi:uncharacterized protein LOC130446973 [Diorhabda sublineata]|uniref:uncharacterized protein LOC130446973 n=1 Tax=Diorhabda sublineata TaxID=1163346 RepID=UPI0024E130DC|nr:uncharacterized protein LOC130446973 [Diorhabda sublineata]
MISGGYRDVCPQKGYCKQLYCGQLDSKMSCFLSATKKKGLTIIYVVRNGVCVQVPSKIVLRKNDLKSWDLILRFLSKKLDIPEGAAYICTIFGEMLCDPRELQHGFVYVVVPYQEDFVKLDYLQCFKYMCCEYRRNYVVDIKPASCLSKRKNKYGNNKKTEHSTSEKITSCTCSPNFSKQTNNKNPAGCSDGAVTSDLYNFDIDSIEINEEVICSPCSKLELKNSVNVEKPCYCGNCSPRPEVKEIHNLQNYEYNICNNFINTNENDNNSPETIKTPFFLNYLKKISNPDKDNVIQLIKPCGREACPVKINRRANSNQNKENQIKEKKLVEGCFYENMTGKFKRDSHCCPKKRNTKRLPFCTDHSGKLDGPVDDSTSNCIDEQEERNYRKGYCASFIRVQRKQDRLQIQPKGYRKPLTECLPKTKFIKCKSKTCFMCRGISKMKIEIEKMKSCPDLKEIIEMSRRRKICNKNKIPTKTTSTLYIEALHPRSNCKPIHNTPGPCSFGLGNRSGRFC